MLTVNNIENIDKRAALGKYNMVKMFERRSKYQFIEKLISNYIITALLIIFFITMIVLTFVSTKEMMFNLLILFWIIIIFFKFLISIVERCLQPF